MRQEEEGAQLALAPEQWHCRRQHGGRRERNEKNVGKDGQTRRMLESKEEKLQEESENHEKVIGEGERR